MPNRIDTSNVSIPLAEQALERAAQHIRDARGNDPVTSRDDMKAYLADLPEGKERALANMFFKFVDHRDSGRGARVTNSDIDKTLAYAKKRLIQRLDRNQDGELSNQEIAGISRIGRLAVEIAREAQRPTVPRNCPVNGFGSLLDEALADNRAVIEGDPCNITFAKLTSDNDVTDVSDLVRAMLNLDGADSLQRLNIGLISQWDGEDSYAEAMGALKADGVKPALKDVFIGDFSWDESEISWVDIGNISDLYAATPNLEKLKVKGGGIELGNLDAVQNLKSIELHSGGLTAGAIQSVAAANLPNLQKAELWFGAEEYGAEGNVRMLDRLLQGTGVPALKDLGLMNSEFSDDIATALTTAPIVRQLERLDLSMGTLTDAGAQAIADNAQHFAHLSEINVDDNYLTQTGIDALQAAFGDKVKVGTQDKFDPNYPDDPRYVSVGE